jgi:diguanylate cyclase (GGDEF)-like protein
MKTIVAVSLYAEANKTRQNRLKALSLSLSPNSFTNWGLSTLLYFAASWGGVLLGQTPVQADILWPANGILLAFLLVQPRRQWVSYLAGGIAASLAVHQIFGFPISHAWIFSVANTIEVLTAAIALAPDGRKRPDLTNLATIGRFLVFGVLLAPLVSTASVEMFRLAQGEPSSLLGLWNWFIGDAMGIAIMTPLVLAIEQEEIALLFRGARRTETLLILLGLTALSWAVFAQTELPIVFVLFPALLLAIFRLGSSGSALGLFLMVVPAAYFTVQQRGPFAPESVAAKSQMLHSIFLLQCFLGVSLVTLYSVSAALAERDRLQNELSAAFKEADANAGLDHVTGVANRRAFDRQLTREWLRAAREKVNLSLIMIDVDHFKLYNDQYGHLAGDVCLRAIGSILANAPLRATDLAARYGGEEFAIILPRAGLEGASLLAERIRQNVADLCLSHLANTPGIVTISMGVATILPTVEWDETKLIEMADRALYQAKKGGRNQVQRWDESMI